MYMPGKTAVIVGGGRVALRKIHSLLAAGTGIRLVAPEVCPEIAELAAAGYVSVRLGSYVTTDLDNAFLVVAATNDAAANLAVAADAVKCGILVAVADNPTAGNCTFPAVLRRGNLEIAVSTGGRCPTLAADIRDVIADLIGEEYGAVLEQVAAEREKLLTDGNPSTYNEQVLRSLAGRLIAELTERKDTA
jgi:precorrin-2 dehydrogenase/sirohydrochlorin ferrochelatase